MKKQKKLNPPWLPKRLLKLIVNKDESYSVIGDFDEEYFERIEEFGAGKARLWYWTQLFRSLPLIIKDSIYLLVFLQPFENEILLHLFS